jgi:hypothetical protein
MGQAASPAPEAQMLHEGDMVIQFLPESHQIVFSVLEDKKINPIIFDLNKGLIYNASFAQTEDTSGVPP